MAVFAIGLAAGNAGLAGSLADRRMTLFTLGSAVGVGLVAALGGRTQRARILGWLFAAVMAQAFVLTVGLVAGLPRTTSAFGVLAVSAALLVVASRLPRLRRPEAVHEASTLEWSGTAAALIALALAFDARPHLAGLLAAWGAILGISATRPGRREAHRRALFYAALACEVVAWWLLMDLAQVGVIEAYTLPFAAVALLAGLLELRQRPHLGSWVAYGPALIAAFVPTTAVVLTSDTADLREVLLLLGGGGDAHLRRDAAAAGPGHRGCGGNGDFGDSFHHHPGRALLRRLPDWCDPADPGSEQRKSPPGSGATALDAWHALTCLGINWC